MLVPPADFIEDVPLFKHSRSGIAVLLSDATIGSWNALPGRCRGFDLLPILNEELLDARLLELSNDTGESRS